MDEKKKLASPPQEKFEELSDTQLSQANGGIEIQKLPRNEKPTGLKLGQAVKKPSVFTKSDDQLPSGN